MNDIDLPLSERCKNCNGHGYVWLSGYSDNEKLLICSTKNLALISDNKSKARCLICNGTGSLKMNRLELVK